MSYKGKRREEEQIKMEEETEKIDRIYERLEKAILEEDCTYEEAKKAVNKLREIYFNRKAGNLIKKIKMREIASVDLNSYDCKHHEVLQ